MLGSVLPASERIGVSTSSTPRAWKNSRIVRYSAARSRSAAGDAAGAQSGLMLLQQGEQRGFVVHGNTEFLRGIELGAGLFAGVHRGGLLRHAARDFRAERFEA